MCVISIDDIKGELMEILNASLLINIQMALGEGPLWNKYSGKLNFVDIDNKKIYEYDPTKKS